MDNKAIHNAIAKTFVEHHVGFNRRPILLSTLVRLTAANLGYENPNPAITLKIAALIYSSDKYCIIKQGTLDTVISSK